MRPEMWEGRDVLVGEQRKHVEPPFLGAGFLNFELCFLYKAVNGLQCSVRI